MNTGRLRQVLTDISAVLVSGGSKKPAEDLQRVADLMKGREHQDVEQFLVELQSALRPPTPEELSQSHIVRLKNADLDDTAFEQALNAITGDKSLKLAEATIIARAYIGGQSKWTSKSKALDAIRKEFVARRYDAKKMEEVARSRPW